jgi:hypothetical protein
LFGGFIKKGTIMQQKIVKSLINGFCLITLLLPINASSKTNYTEKYSSSSHAKLEKNFNQNDTKQNVNSVNNDLEQLLAVLKKETLILADAFKIQDINYTAQERDVSKISRSQMIDELGALKNAVSGLHKIKSPSVCSYTEKVNPVLDDLISMAQSRKFPQIERDSKKISSVFTQIRRLLHTLIEKVESGFSELETSVEEIAGDISVLQLTVDSRLDIIEDSLEDCCFSLESKLDNLTVGAPCNVATFESKLDDCCFSLESKLDNLPVNVSCSASCDVNSTFTVLAAIESSLDTCCLSLGSSLDGVSGDVAGGFNTTNSKLDVCCSFLESKLDNLTVSASCDTFTFESKLDACCFSLESKIDNFSCSSSCAATPITMQTTINSSGVYCLAHDLTIINNMDAITINTSDVVVDLNGYAIHQNSASANGITINTGFSNIVIKNGFIDTVSSIGNGINISSDVTTLQISDVSIKNFGIGILAASTLSQAIIENCNVHNNVTVNIRFNSCNSIEVKNCQLNNATSTAPGVGNGLSIIAPSNDVLISNCVANNNAGNGIMFLAILERAVQCGKIINCQANGNGGSGYDIENSADILMKSNLACFNNIGFNVGAPAPGLLTSVCLMNNTAKGNTTDGFILATGGGTLDALVQDNVSFENGTGFNNSTPNGNVQQYFTNIAFNNGTNYGGTFTSPFDVNGSGPVSPSSATNFWQNVMVP